MAKESPAGRGGAQVDKTKQPSPSAAPEQEQPKSQVRKTKAPASDTSAPTNIDAIAKSNLDLAWMKIQNALQQEAEGHKLWIQGTLELIRSLDDARKRLGSDQAFGTWLTDNGYGENRITRHDRAALLNMALDLNVTREVLEKTNRRSWRLIWEDEIQNRLPSAGQPPDDKQPDEAPAITRRSKKAKGAKKTTTEEQADEWLRDRQCFFRDGLVTFNNVIAMQNTLRQCTPEQRRKLQEEVDSVWLGKLEQSGEVSLWLRDWFNGALEEEANALIQQGRVKRTPARASASAQSGA